MSQYGSHMEVGRTAGIEQTETSQRAALFSVGVVVWQLHVCGGSGGTRT